METEIRNHLEQAGKLIESDDYEGAVSCLEKALELDSYCQDAFLYLYHVSRMIDCSDRIVRVLERSISRDADHALAMYYLGRISVDRRNNYEQAVSWLNRAVELDDLNMKAWATLGLVHMKLKQYDKCLRCCAMVLDIFPDDPDANCLASISYARSGKLEEAHTALHSAMNCDSDYAWVYVTQAVINEEQREVEKAIQYYQRAIETDPTLYEAYDLLGQLYYEKLNQRDDCFHVLNKLKEICPNYSFSHNYLDILEEGNTRTVTTNESLLVTAVPEE